MEVITLSQEEITKYQVIKDSLDRKICWISLLSGVGRIESSELIGK